MMMMMIQTKLYQLAERVYSIQNICSLHDQQHEKLEGKISPLVELLYHQPHSEHLPLPHPSLFLQMCSGGLGSPHLCFLYKLNTSDVFLRKDPLFRSPGFDLDGYEASEESSSHIRNQFSDFLQHPEHVTEHETACKRPPLQLGGKVTGYQHRTPRELY